MDTYRLLLLLTIVVAVLLAGTDVMLERLSSEIKSNHQATIDNRKSSCYNSEYLTQQVSPACVGFHIPIPVIAAKP